MLALFHDWLRKEGCLTVLTAICAVVVNWYLHLDTKH